MRALVWPGRRACRFFASRFIACVGGSALVACTLVACSSKPPVAHEPAPPSDAAVAVATDAAAPDAGVSAAVANAPAWVFGYHTPERSVTWTLRFGDGGAVIDIANERGATPGTTRYTGTATDAATLAIDVSTTTGEMKLDCKRVKKPFSTKCNDTKAKPIDVLECFHKDFTSPMTFAAAPGVEYVKDASCTGYRLAK